MSDQQFATLRTDRLRADPTVAGTGIGHTHALWERTDLTRIAAEAKLREAAKNKALRAKREEIAP
jgi:hypothetical protein